MDYYKVYMIRYLLSADDEMKKASKQHWLKCHADNIMSGREDMIVFSAKILSAIALADSIIETYA